MAVILQNIKNSISFAICSYASPIISLMLPGNFLQIWNYSKNIYSWTIYKDTSDSWARFFFYPSKEVNYIK